MTFKSLGGVSAETEKVIKNLNRMIAENQDTPHGEVATRFWQRVSIDIQGRSTGLLQGEWREGKMWKVREGVCLQGRGRF